MPHLYIPMKQLEANPHRDIANYPIVKSKVDSLIESIEKTGWWDGLMARIKPGQKLPEGYKTWDEFLDAVSAMPKEEQLKITSKLKFEKSFGHHRYAAALKKGIKVASINVRVMDDTVMILAMANENKDDWSNDVLVQLETVKQLYNFMQKQLDESDDWDAYKKAGHDLIPTKAAFEAAKSNGIGYRTLHKALGKTWSENTVNAAHGALACIRDGVYEKTTVQGFPSVDGVRRFNSLATAIRESELPPILQDHFIEESAAVIKAQGASGKTIDSTTSQFKKGNDPVVYLKSQMPTALKIKPIIKNWIREEINFAVLPGFDNEKWKGIVEECRKELDKAAEREKKEAEREAEIKKLMDGGMSKEEAAAEVNKTAGPVKEVGPEDTDDGGEPDAGMFVEDETGDVTGGTEAPGPQVLATVAYSAFSTTQMQAEKLMGKVQEVDREEFPEFFTSMEALFCTITILMGEAIGYKAVRKLVTDTEKSA